MYLANNMFGMAYEHDTSCDKPCLKCGKNPCPYMRIACDIKEHICDDCLKNLKGQWVTYIVQCSDYTLYTGATNDLFKRINKHNAGTGAKYTKIRRPVSLIRFFICTSKSEALKLEYKIKQLSRDEKLVIQI